jgi:hypothetical protein
LAHGRHHSQDGRDRDDTDANIAWSRNAVAEFSRYGCGGLYLNYPGFLEEQDKDTRATFGAKYGPLQALKKVAGASGSVRGESSATDAVPVRRILRGKRLSMHERLDGVLLHNITMVK